MATIYRATSIAFNEYEAVGELLAEVIKTETGELEPTGRHFIRESQINREFTKVIDYDYLVDINKIIEVE